jgi:two-component sensor histidine kinase/PAS domain-containing protein
MGLIDWTSRNATVKKGIPQRREVPVDAKVYESRLPEADANLLNQIRKALPILSDLSRSDLLLYIPVGEGEAIVSDQARPHSIYPVYEEDLVGKRVDAHDAPWVFRALASTELRRGVQSGKVRDAPIVREVLPVLGSGGRAIAALSIETNLLAHERHRRRSRVFQRALQQLQEMVLRGELADAEKLSPFGEHDGIVVIDLQRRIQYMSGIAANLYRRIGYMGNLLHQSIYTIETADAELVDEALNKGACVEREREEHGRVWIRKAIPLYARKEWWKFWVRSTSEVPSPTGSVPVGVMLTVHDATEARDKERELKAKLAMVQEIHHRVKNNLQVIASLLRLQARRATLPEVEQALQETVNRILSVAVVHEFLSYDSGSVINLRDVTQRIVEQMVQSVVDPNKNIRFQLTGPAIYLSSQQATACALVINELLLNAVEHGYEQRNVGEVTIELNDEGEWVSISVSDDGTGLPSGFDLDEQGGLGLRIVRTLVQGDLKGKFTLQGDKGVKAIVTFPKTSLGGAKS